MQTLPRVTEVQHDDPSLEAKARYWVAQKSVDDAVAHGWDREWFFGWRDITGQEKWRTFVPSSLPKAAVGDKFLLAFPQEPSNAPLLQAVWSSLVFDYVSRQKVSGTSMKYFTTRQLACPRPSVFRDTPSWSDQPLDSFIRARVVELTYTSTRMKAYAIDVVMGEPGSPYRWITERRAQLTAEVDGAMLHLYGLDRNDSEHVLNSFPVVRKYDERDHGEFRTKRLVLAAYDAMAVATASGIPFVSPLDPAPGFGPRHPEVSHD